MRKQGDGRRGCEPERRRRKPKPLLAGERALVEGRRPGGDEAAVFDETAVESVPGGPHREGPTERSDRLGGAARQGVRGYVAGSARG